MLIGNMIGRTTTIGGIMALLFILYVSIFNTNNNIKSFWIRFGIILLVFIPVIIFLYKTNHVVHENVRFAFEGFYSLWEKGRGYVSGCGEKACRTEGSTPQHLLVQKSQI